MTYLIAEIHSYNRGPLKANKNCHIISSLEIRGLAARASKHSRIIFEASLKIRFPPSMYWILSGLEERHHRISFLDSLYNSRSTRNFVSLKSRRDSFLLENSVQGRILLLAFPAIDLGCLIISYSSKTDINRSCLRNSLRFSCHVAILPTIKQSQVRSPEYACSPHDSLKVSQSYSPTNATTTIRLQ